MSQEANHLFGNTMADSIATAAGATLPYAYPDGFYNAATSGFSNANPAMWSPNGSAMETLDSLVNEAYSLPATQTLNQQAMLTRNTGPVPLLDQWFAGAAQRAAMNRFSDSAQSGAHSAMVPSLHHTHINMLAGTSNAAVDDAHAGMLDDRWPDSPTLGTSASTDLELFRDHRANEPLDYQTPHFSDFPSKCTTFQ